MDKKIKAIGLLSGGLDSTLAVKVMLEQNIEVVAMNFTTLFCRCNGAEGCRHFATELSEQLGVKLKIISMQESFLEILKNPKYGYGKNVNPCIDCRINMFKEAAKYMKEYDAQFLFTGEVLGQRPMSQHRRAMNIIDQETGLKGLILRPLSAKLLEPTIPEIEGWVDRDKLMNISGRSRKPQMSMAELFEIKDYPCAAGGCLLTYPEFALKVKDLMKFQPDFDSKDIVLLKYGRHLRLNENAKLVVGRNEKENNMLEHLADKNDYIIYPSTVPGPTAIIKGNPREKDICASSEIVAYYSDNENSVNIDVIIKQTSSGKEEVCQVKPCSKDFTSSLNITVASDINVLT